jgi:ribosome-binding factor A
MKSRKKRQPDELPCDDLHADDGVDPRIYFDNREDSRDDHRAERLCAEVARCASFVLTWGREDPALQMAEVVEVRPDPDASHLRICVVLPPDAGELGRSDVLTRLQGILPELRRELARSANRRKTPELAFEVTLDGDVT